MRLRIIAIGGLLLAPFLLAAPGDCGGGSTTSHRFMLKGDSEMPLVEMTLYRHHPLRELVFNPTDGLGPLVHDDCIAGIPRSWASNQLEVCNEWGCFEGQYITGPASVTCLIRVGEWVPVPQ